MEGVSCGRSTRNHAFPYLRGVSFCSQRISEMNNTVRRHRLLLSSCKGSRPFMDLEFRQNCNAQSFRLLLDFTVLLSLAASFGNSATSGLLLRYPGPVQFLLCMLEDGNSGGCFDSAWLLACSARNTLCPCYFGSRPLTLEILPPGCIVF